MWGEQNNDPKKLWTFLRKKHLQMWREFRWCLCNGEESRLIYLKNRLKIDLFVSDVFEGCDYRGIRIKVGVYKDFENGLMIQCSEKGYEIQGKDS